MVKSSQTIIWAQVDVLGSESHSIHCPKKTVVWDCDIGNDHHDVPAKHLDFWTWDVANPRTTTPIYLFGFYGHGGGLSREPCSTVYLHFSWRSTYDRYSCLVARFGTHSQRITSMIQFSSSARKCKRTSTSVAWRVCVIACASAIERY